MSEEQNMKDNDVMQQELDDNASKQDKDLEEKDEDKTEKETMEAEKEKEVEMVSIPKSEYEELLNAKKIADEEVKRARADSQNFRKRVEKEKASFLEYASSNVLSKLLSVSDDLHRLIVNGKQDIPETHFNAILAIDQRIESIYDSEDVKLLKIEKNKTAFDPRFHDAVFAMENDEHPPNIIMDVTSNGFIKGDRVLRAAKVVISKTVQKPIEEEKDTEKVENNEVDSPQQNESNDN
jgi:molecular chaperone GrpE